VDIKFRRYNFKKSNETVKTIPSDENATLNDWNKLKLDPKHRPSKALDKIML